MSIFYNSFGNLSELALLNIFVTYQNVATIDINLKTLEPWERKK